MIRRRTYEIRSADVADDGTVAVVASTDRAVSWGAWSEVLVHNEGAVDWSAAFSALLNHDPDQIIGGAGHFRIEGGQLLATLRIDPKATTKTGVSVLDLVRSGALRGVSIGYDYRDQDAEWDAARTVLTVGRWELREVSLTPVQADVEAVTRSKPQGKSGDNHNRGGSPSRQERRSRMDLEQLKAAHPEHAALIDALAGQGVDPEAIMAAVLEAVAAAAGNAEDPGRMEGDGSAGNEDPERSGQATGQRQKPSNERSWLPEAVRFCEQVSVRASLILDTQTKEQAMEIVARELARRLTGGGAAPAQHAGQRTQVTRAAEDKRDAVARGVMLRGLYGRTGQPEGADAADIQLAADLRLRTGLDLVRWFARQAGLEADSLTREDLAWLVIGGRQAESRLRHVRAANVVAGQFATFVLANVMDKALMLGFDQFTSTTHQLWTGERRVSNFQQVTGAALNVGNLVETAENMAFPELEKAEGGYNATIGLWGATLSLTLQALMNDDLGEFMRKVQAAGGIAARTMDRECYTRLSAATWTGNTTSGSGLGTIGNLDQVLEALEGKAQPVADANGNAIPFGTRARFLIVPLALRREAQLATGRIQAPGQTGVPSDLAGALEIIATPYLTGTTYYIAANPNEADTVKRLVMEGFETPQVLEYDPGAIAARNFKIMHPFAFQPVSFVVGGTRYYPGMQQATA